MFIFFENYRWWLVGIDYDIIMNIIDNDSDINIFCINWWIILHI